MNTDQLRRNMVSMCKLHDADCPTCPIWTQCNNTSTMIPRFMTTQEIEHIYKSVRKTAIKLNSALRELEFNT